MVWVSSDLANWEYHPIELPEIDYAPCAVKHRGKYYITASNHSPLYVSDSPLGPFKKLGVMRDIDNKPFPRGMWDPMLRPSPSSLESSARKSINILSHITENSVRILRLSKAAW